MQQFVENRSALLIVPKEPYKEWAKLYNEESLEVLDARLNEKHIYLIEFSYEEDLIDILNPYYIQIFENELLSWNHRKREWPEERSIAVFLNWFKVIFCADIFDLMSETIVNDIL